MLSKMITRHISGSAACGTAALVGAIMVIAAATMGSRYGVSTAMAETHAKNDAITPITIAGRWSGLQYSSTFVPPRTSGESQRNLTLDIVACEPGWCGILISQDQRCGAVALHLHQTSSKNRNGIFEGKLELAKGAAPFVVQASYYEKDGSKTPTLNVIGDTGRELLLMRRSYPLQAELARSGDAQCTLEKATS